MIPIPNLKILVFGSVNLHNFQHTNSSYWQTFFKSISILKHLKHARNTIITVLSISDQAVWGWLWAQSKDHTCNIKLMIYESCIPYITANYFNIDFLPLRQPLSAVSRISPRLKACLRWVIHQRGLLVVFSLRGNAVVNRGCFKSVFFKNCIQGRSNVQYFRGNCQTANFKRTPKELRSFSFLSVHLYHLYSPNVLL